MNCIRTCLVICCLCLLSGSVLAETGTQTLIIGGLLPLSGNASAPGPSYQAAMELAAEELNEKYANLGLPYTIELRIADTESNPEVAKERGEEMIRDGIRFIVGPITSAEMEALKEQAAAAGTILIGFGSTTPGLPGQDNTIIRLCPDDSIQALALQGLFSKTNITTIIPVVRNDIYGQTLYGLLSNLSENGSFSMTDPIFYEPGADSFNETIDAVSQSAKEAGQDPGRGVLIIGFNEAVDILQTASQSPDLGSLPWFGTDGVALIDTLVQESDATAFAAKTNFTATIYGELENEPKYAEFAEKIQSVTGMKATAYAVVIHDAVELSALTGMMDQEHPDNRARFVDNADHYYGASGYTALTDAGDRKFANIDFWRVREEGGAYSWSKIGRFINQMVGPIVQMNK